MQSRQKGGRLCLLHPDGERQQTHQVTVTMQEAQPGLPLFGLSVQFQPDVQQQVSEQHAQGGSDALQ